MLHVKIKTENTWITVSEFPFTFSLFKKTLLLPPSPAFLPESGFSLSHFTFTDENESPRFDLTAL